MKKIKYIALMLLIGIFTATAPATEIKENNSMQNRHITLSI